MTLITCSNCKKRFNREPARLHKNSTGLMFCCQNCLHEYKAKHPEAPVSGGSCKKGVQIAKAIDGLTPGKEYTIYEIMARCEHRYRVDVRQVSRHLAATESMSRVRQGVWVKEAQEAVS